MLLLLATSYFFYFHAPNGDLIGIKALNGQAIVRKSPPGYACCTLIQTGAGSVIVKESVCDVLHALDLHCNRDKQ